MSRQELAQAVNAHVFTATGRVVSLDGNYIGKLERGAIRWPYEPYRAALRAVLGATRDADLGLFIARQVGTQAPPIVPDGSGVTAVVDNAPAVDVGAALVLPEVVTGVAAVQVNVSAEAGTAVTVVCQDGAAGRVAVVAGGVRVLIDASGTDPASLTPAVVDFPAAPGGARLYSLAERRAR